MEYKELKRELKKLYEKISTEEDKSKLLKITEELVVQSFKRGTKAVAEYILNEELEKGPGKRLRDYLKEQEQKLREDFKK